MVLFSHRWLNWKMHLFKAEQRKISSYENILLSRYFQQNKMGFSDTKLKVSLFSNMKNQHVESEYFHSPIL